MQVTNIHIERPLDFYPKKFLNLLCQYGLLQRVPLVPTHNMGGTLDLVITTEELKKKIQGQIDVIHSGTSSDHFLVLVDLNISYRNFNKIDIEDFKKDMRVSRIRQNSLYLSLRHN